MATQVIEEGTSVTTFVKVLKDRTSIPYSIDSNVRRYYADGGYNGPFVVTEQFKDLLRTLDEGKKRRLLLAGPKGVGKTASLFAVSVLSTHRPCLVYYLNADPERFRAYASFMYQLYQSVEPPATKKAKLDETMTDPSTGIWKIVDQFIDHFQREEPILLIDLSSWTTVSTDKHEPVQRILANDCMEGVTTVVATSSGNMKFSPLPPSPSAASIINCIKRYRMMNFIPFSDEEVNIYVSLFADNFEYLRAERKNDAVEKLKELTNNNPLLLAACFLEHNFASAAAIVENDVRKFSEAVWNNLQKANFVWVASKVEFSLSMLYSAANGMEISQTERSQYHMSWLASEGITYVVREDCNHFVLALNFPLMLKYIRNMLQEKPYTEDLQFNMIIKGYRFEHKVLKKLDDNEIAITYSKEGEGRTAATFKFGPLSSLQPGQPLRRMTSGVLYYLREQHPVIDAVAIVVKGDEVWLLMIQVSLSQYRDHQSKAAHLFKEITYPEKNDENASLNWLQYYEKLVSPTKTMYIYVSPNEIESDENPHDILGDCGIKSQTKEMYFGVIMKDSKTQQEIKEIESSL